MSHVLSGTLHVSFIFNISCFIYQKKSLQDEPLEKLKALLDQMNTVTTISNYVQHGDISQGLIPFSDSYSDPWIIDSRASNHMTGSSHFFFNYIPSVGKKKFL